jgi:O-antigen ligase
MHDARWGIYAATWTAIKEFYPIGSGVGTYAEVFQRFQTADLSGMFINNAHNDYLEWLMEGGLPAGILIATFIFLYIVRWLTAYTGTPWRTHNFIQVAAGLSVLAMLLHSLLDFNLHIPANQIYLALMAGLFFRVNGKQRSGQDSGLD